MPKDIIFDESVRSKIQDGLNKLAQAVRVTLGPTGRVVMIERDFGDPIITKDGVTVAKHIDLEDKLSNMAAMMVRQAASKTASEAGDGTTTATIYTEAIYGAGIKSVLAGANPQDLKNGMNKAVQAIVHQLERMAKPITSTEEIKQVAACSANQDNIIGSIIADAMDKVGKDGVVTIEEGKTLDTSVSVVDGYQFDKGYMSQHFVTNKEKMVAEYEEPYILLSEDRIDDLKSLLGMLELAIKKGQRPIVIIADDFDDTVMTTLTVNHLRGSLKVLAIKSPGFGDRRKQMMEDIATITGAKVFSKASGVTMKNPSIDAFGSCEKITASDDSTIIVEGAGDESEIEERINQIRTQLESVGGDFDKEKLQERLSKLIGGVARIVVGGATEVEVREKKDRIDDALHACKAAVQEGILPGGGVAVLRAFQSVSLEFDSRDEEMGVGIIFKAIEDPIRQIAKNTGKDDGAVLAKVMESSDANFGFNAAKDSFENLIDAGIIVPAKVERIALQNAASIAALLLATDCMISIIPEVAPAQPDGIYPGM